MNLAKKANELYGNEKPIRQWFKHLEDSIGYAEVNYIIRSLYSIVIGIKKRGYGKDKLVNEIERFERDSLLPKMFSLFKPDYLISELEDIQHLYPVSRRVINLPTFVQ